MSVAISLKDFLTKSDYKILNIPQYQRDYSWEQKQFDELWEDLESIDVEQTADSELKIKNSHFIGLLVLITNEFGNIDIVDGQQRLTTLYILLNCIRDSLLDLKKGEEKGMQDKIAKKIQRINNLIYQDTSADKLKKRFFPNNNDKKYFDDVMFFLDGENIDKADERTKEYYNPAIQIDSFSCKMKYIESRNNKNVVRGKSSIKCYSFYFKEIKKALDETTSIKEKMLFLESLKLKIEEGLKIMIFDSRNESDAFNLFETLNDRGLALASIDLIKNKILKSVPEEDRDEASRKWDDIFGSKGKLSGENTNSFLRYYYISEKKYITKTELYKEWKKWIDEQRQDHILEFISRLAVVANNFYAIKNNDGIDDMHLSGVLGLLKKTNSTQWHSIGFPLKEIWDNNGKNSEERRLVHDVLWLITIITVRFIINETRFNILEKKFPVIAKCLSLKNKVFFSDEARDGITESQGKFSSDLEALQHAIVLLNWILDKYSPDNSINLDDKDFENNALATLLLRMAYNSQLHHGQFISKDLTLEHILPIKHKQEWMSHDDFADRVKYKLGNMLLVNQELNSSLSNGSFKDKKEAYGKYDVFDIPKDTGLSYEEINSQDDWSEDFVNRRTTFIIGIIKPLLLSRKNPYV